MTTESTFAPEYLAAARAWFEEVLQAARAVHAIGERGAAEGILLALDRWLLARDVSSGPSAELAMVVQAILGDDVMRPFGPYDPATSVLGNPVGAHITLTFDDAAALGRAVFARLDP
ncbi:hypothetical protein ACWDR7_06320 [Microbacterium sp. NPDC003461]